MKNKNKETLESYPGERKAYKKFKKLVALICDVELAISYMKIEADKMLSDHLKKLGDGHDTENPYRSLFPPMSFSPSEEARLVEIARAMRQSKNALDADEIHSKGEDDE